MNLAAIHHEATQRWCHAIAPGRFIIRIQTGKDELKSILLHTRDKYIPLKWKDTRRSHPMRKVASDGLRDYYEAELCMDLVCLRYCFELEGLDGSRVILANDGFADAIPEDKERHFDCCQNLREEELFSFPRWAEDQVVYQIFPSRFASSRQVSDRVWYQAPIRADADLGGDLRGIIQRLPHMRDLGVDVIYMTPVFRSNTTHKYDTIDYYSIDPSFGTTQDLAELVEKAHAMGIRVMLDAVFNHSGTEFFAFSDLKKNKENSPYRDWFYPGGFPLHRLPKPNYKCFGYFGNMPKLNLQNPETARYFIDVALYWMERTGIDGWRLDVGDEVSHSFWRLFRREIKNSFPDALIVGEIWHHAPDFLQGDQWDSVMNYPFHRAVEDFAATGSITASVFAGRLGLLRGNSHSACYHGLWNLIGSHDTSRILYRCGGDKRRHRLAAALLLLSPGSAMLYYGDEVGMDGADDPDCRRGMLWDPARQDSQMLGWYKSLIRLRKTCPAITRGMLVTEQTDDESGFIRLIRGTKEQTVEILFLGKDETLPLPEYNGRIDLITGQPFDGIMRPFSALVFA